MPYVFDDGDRLYHFVHSIGFHPDGTLNSGAFASLRRDPNLSVAIAKLIPADSFEEFCGLMPWRGVAQLTVGSIREFGIDVRQEPDPAWGRFSEAHAVIFGYDGWTKRTKTDASRAWSEASNALGVLRKPPA